ncbi:hypothetical protein V2J09_005788 [Rumex salicifolius]
MDSDHHSPPPPPPQPKTYTLTASSISFTKSTQAHLFKPSTNPTHILHKVSFTANPSQILAVVGPSGAGKSTLLDILAARTSPTSGDLLLNSSPVGAALSSYRKLSAYVPQHDATLPLLTVSETFSFAASLLHPTLTRPSRASLVTSLLSDLRLLHLSHSRLSGSLSGGERRRVSIGLSLLQDPRILILDEPTSGLDSGSALNVMLTLKGISRAKMTTVVLSIHQPGFKILAALDAVLLLSKGRVVHHGSVATLQGFLARDGFHVPPQLNALEYAMEILDQLQECEKDRADQDPVVQGSSVECSVEDRGSGDDRTAPTPSDGAQLQKDIAVRFWKIIYRTKQLLLTNALEALGVGLVLGTIYINIGYDKQSIQKRLGLFAFTLTFLLSSTTETLPIFLNERPILLQETSSGVYRLSSYLIANTLVFLPYLLCIALLYSVSVYFLVGLCATWQAFSYFVLVIWIINLMANSFVLFLSSLAPNYITGTSLVTVVLGGFFLFSGYFISQESMPKYWLFMHFLSMYKYALDALLINEYSCLTSRCLVWYDEKNKTCMMTGKDVMEKRGLHVGQRWTNVYALLGFFLLYRALCLLVLIRRVSRLKK